MPRYIDAEELEKRINKYVKMGSYATYEQREVTDWCKDECIRQIHVMPTADVAEVKHGEWMKEGCGLRVCSECNFEYDHAGMPNEGLEYCPNCGAKMDGERKEK